MGDLARPAGRQLHQVAVMLTGLVERLAGAVDGKLRDDALSGLSAARLLINEYEQPMPDLVEMLRELRKTMTFAEATIASKANEIATAAIVAAKQESDAQVADLESRLEVARNRWDDLEREMRRQFYAAEKGRAVYGNALIDVRESLKAEIATTDDAALLQVAISNVVRIARAAGPIRRLPIPERPEPTIRDFGRDII